MPRKPRGGSGVADDIIKGLLHAIESAVPKAERAAARGIPKALKKSERVVTAGVKKFEKTVKPKRPAPLVTKPAKKAAKKAAPKPKTGSAGGGSKKPPTKSVTAGGAEFPVPKRPKREGMDIYRKGRSLARGTAEQREAERSANWWLRKGGSSRPPRPEDVRMGTGKGVPPKVGTSKSRPKGRSSEYEADIIRRQAAADARRIGSGVKKAKKNNKYAPKKKP